MNSTLPIDTAPADIAPADFIAQFNQQGYVLMPPMFSEEYLERMKAVMLELIEVEKKIINKPDYKDDGFLLCAPYYAERYPEILDVLKNKEYLSCVEAILDKWFTLYLYTNNCIPPNNGKTKAVRIHVDTPRIIPGYNYLVATIILLDDFNEENGATWILPASHNEMEQPEEDYFYAHAQRIVAPKGSVIFFNPRIWHSAGINNSDKWRNCLIIAFCKPWLKQRVDIPRFMQHVDTGSISGEVLQLLGFNATPPSCFEEFYGDETQRTFTQPFV